MECESERKKLAEEIEGCPFLQYFFSFKTCLFSMLFCFAALYDIDFSLRILTCLHMYIGAVVLLSVVAAYWMPASKKLFSAQILLKCV